LQAEELVCRADHAVQAGLLHAHVLEEELLVLVRHVGDLRFERGFIRAEVATYDDFVAHGGEQGAKEAGKLRLEGKDYVVRDGDVIHFRFNV